VTALSVRLHSLLFPLLSPLPFADLARSRLSFTPGTHDNEQYCLKKVFTYNARYENGDLATGGYADSVRVNERFVFPIPEGMNLAEAAPLMCAGCRYSLFSASSSSRICAKTRRNTRERSLTLTRLLLFSSSDRLLAPGPKQRRARN